MRTSSILLATVALAVGLGGGYGFAHFAAPAPEVAPAAAAPADPRGKLLYYRNPMGLPDTSAVPKKDNMGMDYIAVYQNEAAEADDGLKITAAKLQKLGVCQCPAVRYRSRSVSLIRCLRASWW